MKTRFALRDARGLQDDLFIPRTKTEQEFARLTKAAISRSARRRPDKIKFKLLKTGPWLLPVGSRSFTSGECNDRNRSP
jgi:hypothetical protein